MGNVPRIEISSKASFITSMIRNHEMWLANQPKLEQVLLGYLAKYATKYGVTLYAVAFEGSHHHEVALFPKLNRAAFMRDFNAMIAKSIQRHAKSYPGGKVFARPYSEEKAWDPEDIEIMFFYTALQPVNDGLVDDLKDYPFYNFFEDAITGRTRTFKVMNWTAYNEARRWNPNVKAELFLENYDLKFARLPGYEHLSDLEYANKMRAKLKFHQDEIIKKRKAAGKPTVGREKLVTVVPGSPAKHPKTSNRWEKRPRILAKDPRSCRQGYDWFWDVVQEYRAASSQFRSGDLATVFPIGTYKPPVFTYS